MKVSEQNKTDSMGPLCRTRPFFQRKTENDGGKEDAQNKFIFTTEPSQCRVRSTRCWRMETANLRMNRGWNFPKAIIWWRIYFLKRARERITPSPPAQQQLGCQVEDFSASWSSVQKGKACMIRSRNLWSDRLWAVVIRHTQEEYFWRNWKNINIPILNGGTVKESSARSVVDLLTIYHESLVSLKVCG